MNNAAPTRRRTASKKPSLRLERALQRHGYPLLAGMDEVGRGALAGPVSVGVVVIDPCCPSGPQGVRDSKLLTHRARSALVPRLRRWARAYAVGHAWPTEIDAIGIMGGLRLAGMRALGSLGVVPDLVILDGNHDWLTDPARVGLFAELGGAPTAPPVRTMIKADMKCSSVAAASVLAKVERDAIMVDLAPAFAQYHWAENKGYAATEHCAALEAYGPCVHHRQSWRLPGVANLDGPAAAWTVALDTSGGQIRRDLPAAPDLPVDGAVAGAVDGGPPPPMGQDEPVGRMHEVGRS